MKEYHDYVAHAELLLNRGYVTHMSLKELIEKLQKADLEKEKQAAKK